jgi:hypothetical protein
MAESVNGIKAEMNYVRPELTSAIMLVTSHLHEAI